MEYIRSMVRGGSQQADGDEGAGLLPVRELDAIERAHPEGMSSAQVVEVFRARGVKLSEATFRKYVQLGLLPRSRRVGRKGKHQGSMGLYPSTVVRRVNAIKQMMAESYTIEEIQRSFLRFKDEIEAVERGLKELFVGFERELRSARSSIRGARSSSAKSWPTRDAWPTTSSAASKVWSGRLFRRWSARRGRAHFPPALRGALGTCCSSELRQ